MAKRLSSPAERRLLSSKRLASKSAARFMKATPLRLESERLFIEAEGRLPEGKARFELTSSPPIYLKRKGRDFL
jgi:hypothetical protein